MGRISFPRLLALSLVLTASVASHAQWSFTDLHHPSITYDSVAYAADGNNQVGYAGIGSGLVQPTHWSSTSASFQNLNDTAGGSAGGIMFGAQGGHQVGQAQIAGVNRASLYSGTPSSRVDLHPSGAFWSEARGVYGSQQVGSAGMSAGTQAILWSGTSTSALSLHPSGFTSSNGHGIFGTTQVGKAEIGGHAHAGLWHGTSGSFVDLNPVGATDSEAWGVSATTQVGEAYIGGVGHAALWTGTAASFVDLHPVGFSGSQLLGALGSYQVGYAYSSGAVSAGIWQGTAGSFVDLSDYLTPDYSFSQANGISTDGANLYVVGAARHNPTMRYHAVMWTMPVPEPGTWAALGLGAAALARRRRR